MRNEWWTVTPVYSGQNKETKGCRKMKNLLAVKPGRLVGMQHHFSELPKTKTKCSKVITAKVMMSSTFLKEEQEEEKNRAHKCCTSPMVSPHKEAQHAICPIFNDALQAISSRL